MLKPTHWNNNQKKKKEWYLNIIHHTKNYHNSDNMYIFKEYRGIKYPAVS